LCRSLVNRDFSPEFRDFMKFSGIRHCTIEMEGTKKVAIPDAVMKSILKVVLNQENHPLLIHCNHGKVHLNGLAPHDHQLMHTSIVQVVSLR
jgi:tyrosine-protein phosphatase SIW14